MIGDGVEEVGVLDLKAEERKGRGGESWREKERRKEEDK